VPRVAPELVILQKDDGTFALAYRVSAFVNHSLPVMFVNAKTGAVELTYNNLNTQLPAAGIGVGVHGDEKKVSGTQQGTLFQAWDQMRPTKIVTNDFKGSFSRMSAVEAARSALAAADIASSASNRWTDPVVVDAHTYLGWTYDYYYKRHAFKGFDNRDSRAVYAIVHPVKREDLSKYNWSEVADYYLNAFFCGQCGVAREDVLMFGEGLPTGYYVGTGQYVTYYAASLDIVAHEYSHGVTGYTSNLIYRNESGALNEAFSDIMATGVEFLFQPVGSGLLKADYLHGEDTYLPSRPGSVYGSRSLVDPAAYGDPDHYSKRYVGTSDGGGVHTNSSIANHAFYLAIEGGTNRTSGLAVHGVGAANREQVERVFFRAFTTLPGDATFSQARAKTIQSAHDLYGAGGTVERAVTEAWTAVGVL
jgi:thermolysin